MNKTTITARQPLLRKEWERKIPAFGRKKIKKWMTQAALPLSVIFIWQLVGMTGTVSKTVLPTPADIMNAAYQLTISGELFTHLKVSIFRAATGFLLGAGIGLLAGIAVGF